MPRVEDPYGYGNMEQSWAEFLQWIGIGGAGGGTLFTLGQKSQEIESIKERLANVETIAKNAIGKTVENGKALAELKTTASMTLDMLKEVREELRENRK